MAEAKLTGLSGIGTTTARVLEDHGFQSISDIAAATVEALCAVPGFGKVRSHAIIAEARQKALLGAAATQSGGPGKSTQDKDGKTKVRGKGKKGKGGKKKRKDKSKKDKDGKKKHKKKRKKDKDGKKRKGKKKKKDRKK